MKARHMVLVGSWVAMLWFYGWLRAAVLFTLICGGIFFGTMFFFALYDAIRTRNDRPGAWLRPQGRKPDEDAELVQLRKLAGL